jgi:signal transduction histidine kinase
MTRRQAQLAAARPEPAPTPGSGPQAPASRAADSLALRIVLVEDSAADVALIRHLLRPTGRQIELIAVETEKQFRTELCLRPPDLILSDYHLPAFDGRAALEISKELAPRTPFIFVTGVLGEEIAIETLKQGATDYVLKNRLTRLAPAVTRALREARQRLEHDEAEERLRHSHDQLRALTGRLQSVREEERTRIAREVHDELGQALTGIKLDLSWVAGRLPADSALHRKLRTMSTQIDSTIHAVRRIATELRPGVLDSIGLAAAIEWQAADFQQRTGIACATTIAVPEALLDRELSTVCFRIFQEALTNIIRHALATQVDVGLALEGPDLVLTVHDNGRGISKEDVGHHRSIGLVGMRERAAQVGGEVSFVGRPALGTTVTMRAPLAVLEAPLP